jgi:pimeloyl-ACP methyl ester carboxylesterase
LITSIHSLMDRIGLNLLHSSRSASSQFMNVSSVIADMDKLPLDQFYLRPELPFVEHVPQHGETDCEYGTFRFESQVFTSSSVNNIVQGQYYRPPGQEQAMSWICIHGWRMNSLHKLRNIVLEPLLDSNAGVYFIQLPYHLDRTPSESHFGGEHMISANIERTLEAVKQAVSDVRALIRWMKSRHEGKVGVIGLSLGGFIANLAAVLDDDIDGLISLFYANRISYSVWKTDPGKYIKQDLQNNEIDFTKLERYWSILDPSRHSPKLPKSSILLVSGKYDRYVLEEDTALLWEKWGRPSRTVLNCGHSGIVLQRKRVAQEVREFLTHNF